MKILKTYESFEYAGEIFIEKICKGWGVQVEDLEDLFVEFSDDGGKVSFSYMEVKDGVIQITIRDIWEDLNDGDWIYNPLWEKRFGRIKRQLNRMGLDMNVIAKSLNHGRYTNVRIFSMSDRKRTHSKTDIVKESFGGPIPDPEPMDVNEWDEEVTDAEEVPFDQKEKELFIALSDSISLKNKIKSMPDIGKSYLYFQLINGDLNPKLREITPISNISIYKNDDEYYYVGLWSRDGMFAERELWAGGEKLYRCDGYECWEKFLKEIFASYRELISKQTKTNESLFNEIPEPEPIDVYEWDREVTEDKEVDFTQKEKELFIALADTIPEKHKIDALYIEDFQLSFSMANGKDPIYPNIRFDNRIRSTTSYKMDDEYYYVNAWEGGEDDGEHNLYRCDGYKCWEKFLKEIFQGYRDLINKKSKTNESYFDEGSEPKSLLDENGDITYELSSDFETREREPFTKSEKSFISKLVNTLNEEYTSIKFYNNKVSTEFRLTMGEMGETTHIVRGVKFTDEYYGVEYVNFIDSEDEYIISECDGFKCFEKLLTKIFDKINKDYDYEGD